MNELDMTYALDEIRKAVAHTLESPSSPLCDCPEGVLLPVNKDGKAMYHHCQCRAVAAAAIVISGHGMTLHHRQHGCLVDPAVTP